MNQEKLWTKDFIIISVVNFFLMLVMYLLLVTMAPYAVEHYHASTSVAGLISGIFIIGTLLGRLATGRVIEKIGSKKVLLAGLVFFLVTTALYFLANSLTSLLATRFLHGISLGVSTTATGTLVAQIIPAAKRGEGIGYFSMSTVLATAVGPFLGIYLSHHTTYSVIFTFCLALGVISFATSFLVKVASVAVKPEQNTIQKPVSKRFSIGNFIEHTSLPIAFVTVIVAFCYSGILSFVAFYAEEIHLSSAASFFFLVYAVAVLLSRPFTGKLMDVRGANMVVIPALVLFAVGMFTLSHAENGATLLLAGVIVGLGFGNFQSCAQAIAIKRAPLHRLGIATSTFFIFLDFGFGVGPYLYGYLIPMIGYRHLYAIMVYVILAALILYYVLHRKRKPQIV